MGLGSVVPSWSSGASPPDCAPPLSVSQRHARAGVRVPDVETCTGNPPSVREVSSKARFLAGRLGDRYNQGFASLLGRRSTVGHRALDAVIGVRIPTSQPAFARASRELRLGRRSFGAPTYHEASSPLRRRLSRRSSRSERSRTASVSATFSNPNARRNCTSESFNQISSTFCGSWLLARLVPYLPVWTHAGSCTSSAATRTLIATTSASRATSPSVFTGTTPVRRASRATIAPGRFSCRSSSLTREPPVDLNAI